MNIKEAIERIKIADCFDYNGTNTVGNICSEEVKIIEKALEKQLNGGWIPISERLPNMDECQKNDNRFIVTDGNRRYQDWFDYVERYFERCGCNGLGLKKDECVIAWQPLPADGKVLVDKEKY